MDDTKVIYDERGVVLSKELTEKLSSFEMEYIKRVCEDNSDVQKALQKLTEEAIDTVNKIVELVTKLCETLCLDIIPPMADSIYEYFKELPEDIDEDYEDEFPRIYHLARFAPKERTRKKNRARLFEMIKALYRPGLCS